MKHSSSSPCHRSDCNDRAAFLNGTQWTYCQRHLKEFAIGPFYKPKQGTSLGDVSPDLNEWPKTATEPKPPVGEDAGIFNPIHGPIPTRYVHPNKPVMMSKHEVEFREQERLALRRAQLELAKDWKANSISLSDRRRYGNKPL